MVTFIICFIYLIKCIDIRLKVDKMIIKPIIATSAMVLLSYCIYNELNINLIMSLMIGVIIYGISILILRILSKDELFMIPYGQKVYKLNEKRRKIKNYKNPVKSTFIAVDNCETLEIKRFERKK